jgi:hypothetical protein
MRIIDCHVHAFADSLAPHAIPALEAAGDLTARYDGTIAGLLEMMDRSGVAVSVVQPVATKPGQVAAINDWAASVASDRIVAFGAMHPELPNPAAEMARMHSLGLRGFKMHPEQQTFEPHGPRMGAIYSSAIEHGMIAFFHAGADVIHPTVLGTPESFERVLDAWPGLTMVLAHLGGYRQWQGVAERLVGRDVWLDTAYTPGHLPDDEFVRIVRAHGADRVLFGSDGPWTDAAHEIELLRGIGLTAEELAGVLGGNAERLLGL